MSQLLLAPQERPSIGAPNKPKNPSALKKTLQAELAAAKDLADRLRIARKFIPMIVILQDKSCVGVLINAFGAGNDRNCVMQELYMLAVNQDRSQLIVCIRNVVGKRCTSFGPSTREVIFKGIEREK